MEKETSISPYLTTGQAAKIAGTTPESIARACRRGTIEAIKVGTFWIVYRESLTRYIANKPKGGRPKKEQDPKTP